MTRGSCLANDRKILRLLSVEPSLMRISSKLVNGWARTREIIVEIVKELLKTGTIIERRGCCIDKG